MRQTTTGVSFPLGNKERTLRGKQGGFASRQPQSWKVKEALGLGGEMDKLRRAQATAVSRTFPSLPSRDWGWFVGDAEGQTVLSGTSC